MRKWFASLAVLGIASAAASAQTMPVPPIGACGESQSLFFDDGTPETSWKVFYPTGAGDAFNVDFDDMAGNMTLTGVALNTFQSTSTGPIGLRYVMVAPDNLGVSSLGKTPDINNPYTILGNLSGTVTITGNPGVSAGYCPGLVGYDLPDVAVMPASGGEHAVTTFLSGDSGTWLCSDLTAPISHRSYFTFNNYSTPAVAMSANLQMRLIATVTPLNGSAYITLNNSPNTASVNQTGNVISTLWSSAAVQPTLYLQGAWNNNQFIGAPNLILLTGYDNFSSNGDPFEGSLCGPVSDPSQGPCIPPNISSGFTAFYIDNADLKKNGHGKIKQTNVVTIFITPDPKNCNPCVCFGQRDDGQLDSTIWKVQNPAGSKDYFNVSMGSFVDPNSGGNCGTTVTGIEAASWDFCGSGPSWASVGLYPANTALDSTGGTPDLANPVALATTLSMAPNSAQFNYPATLYDFPDITTTTNAALANLTKAHTAMQWASGDTCTWIGSDTDGTDDDSTSKGSCSTAPSTTSYFTLNGYTTPAILFSGPNWMMKIDWS